MRVIEQKEGAVESAPEVEPPASADPLKAALLRRRLEARRPGDPAGKEETKAAAPAVKDAAAPALKTGATGIVNKAVELKLDGKETKIPSGTVVQVVKVLDGGKQLSVDVLSGFGGKNSVVQRDDFDFEPGVAIDEDTNKARDDHYEEYKGSLWGKGGPTIDDIHQGYIGDCYLMSAMGAVVARSPAAIEGLFSPKTPNAKSYQVALYQAAAGGKLEKVAFTVDTKLPTQQSSPQNPAYANNGKIGAPLWPALLEKAYAMMVGGYARAGQGGQSRDAFQAFTGVPPDHDSMPQKDKVIESFQAFEKAGKAVDVATVGSISRANQKPFGGKGGHFSAHLTGDEGQDVEVVKSSLTIEDHTSKKNRLLVFDDGKGKIEQKDVVDGTVNYGKGDVALSFHKGKEPDAPKNLETSYDYRELISKQYNLYSNHAYIFVKTQGDCLILKNPWGMGAAYDPKPIPAAAFAKFFGAVSSTTVPGAASPTDEKKR